ncbi:MAG TPA: TPM domain-containing protein, partial [Candidatus Polarisedimenticolia bacterium]|nr:TPM domain-containing protein [Candidatus Polarisedimenticolia bacterium]
MTDLRIVRALARLTVILLCALALGSTAFADDVPRLKGSITDTTKDQVLASGRPQIQPALDDLLRTDDIQLFVLFVDTTGSLTVTEFADESARVNSLGGNDALLVVAMTDRTDAIWRSDAYLDRLTDRELLTVLSQRVEPKLRGGDLAGAVIASAQGIREASATATPSNPSTPSPAPEAGPLVWVLLLVGGGVLAWTVFSSKRRERTETAARQQRDAQRAQEANALLIRADESLRDAKEEMQYAEAQFSPPEVAPYRDAVTGAATELKAAFTIRQQLDDAIPEDADTRRRFVEEIVNRATKALSLLEEQRRRVEEMRDMERRAPELLTELHEQISTAGGRLPGAEQTLAGLARYAERSWSSVKGNVEDARALLARATSAAADGDTALAKDDRGVAAKAIREGQQELAEAGRLIDAIAAAAAAIKEAERSASG